MAKIIKQLFFGNHFISNDLSPCLGPVFKNKRRDFSKVGCSKIKDLWDSKKRIYNLKGLRSLHVTRNPSNVEPYRKLHWLFDLGCCGKLAMGPMCVALISNCLFNQLYAFFGGILLEEGLKVSNLGARFWNFRDRYIFHPTIGLIRWWSNIPNHSIHLA